MLSEFLASNRDLLLARARSVIAEQNGVLPATSSLDDGLPAFFDHLLGVLERAAMKRVSDHSDLSRGALKHGQALFDKGLTVDQVVHDYGGLCQAITGLAVDLKVEIPAAEFRTLNLCLDDAIASAVTEFGRQRERVLSEEGTERLGVLAHEMRNHLNTAMLALASIKKGVVGVGGSTGNILERSLTSMQALVDRSFADVRLDAGLETRERIRVEELVAEIEIGAAMSAAANGQSLKVQSVDESVVVDADRQILTAAITNLLQNAFKFSPKGSTICFRTRSSPSRVFVDVEDECGGLPAGKKESLLTPFVQRGSDRSGLGLGLAICFRSMQTMGGELRVRDMPRKGCVFTIDLPRFVASALAPAP